MVAKKQPSAVDAHVGARVRARRILMGLSQGDLGKLLGITFQQIQKYERGVNRIGAGRLFEMARILSVGLPYFYEGMMEGTPRRASGFAEDPAPAPTATQFLSTPEGTQLVSAYLRIADPKVRRRVLDLVKSMANESKAARSKKKKTRSST
jgi:transcriptional regulator with XRE-family HTH domain